MNIKKIIILISCVVVNFYFGQSEYRDAFTLKLKVDSVRFYQQEIKKSPYFVKDDILQIYPGEHLFIEAEVKNGKIETMKVVKDNINPEKTIEIDFSQNTEERKNNGMLLQVKNPFNISLMYDAMMYIVGDTRWIKTSIIPVKPQLQSFEMWNDPIISLVLDNWRLEK
ncbi:MULTISPECIES: hypothetical protein [Chryseobacterium]|uniref:Uncharacterized protein n=1 Tax=Chryseobacterium rhizosphaerae TaxID=395937 RepID=A0AAE4C522_9FLAO|nr:MULTISPECIES: hypothetical protein [Chryseobacterium]MBL3549440.1 hypothetical protein [Chryseobacterium sp. KMC2]MDC8101335.1 hypothetical protein [Chryseobacterium rhizosphaerae]MDR6529278.1 hypothetical protein [Chryseobacterium rhizosphaerae]